MNVRVTSIVLAALAILAGSTATQAATQAAVQPPRHHDEALVAAFDKVDRNTTWTKTDTIALSFPTYHPQSMEVVGNRIFMTSVQVIEAPQKYATPVDGYDRTPGKGIGHLFVMDRQGHLLKDITLGEGNMYHPGGLDFDGHSLYLPVAQYRPNSSAIVYKVDPTTYAVTKLFTVGDHIGGVVYDRKTRHLIGQSWGSRRFYDWTLEGKQKGFWLNENHFTDYQDCEYVEFRKTLCSGVTGLPAQPGASTGYELGGFTMIDLADRHRITHEVPLQLWSPAGHVITRNPTDLDADGNHLTLYAAPDDEGEGPGTQILIYEADV